MSRIGKKPIEIADGVEIKLNGRDVSVKGPNGALKWQVPEGISVSVDSDSKQILVSRDAETRQGRAFHGLSRALINTLNNGELSLQVGFSHSVDLKVPADVDCSLISPTLIVVKGCDKHAVGQFAANIRAVRPPEPYKGKGVRYQGEFVRRKAGKAFGSK